MKRDVRYARRALLTGTVLSLLELVVANPMHPGVNLHRREPRDVALDRLLSTLPRDLRVATQEEAYTHLALGDPYATLLPETRETALHTPFVIIDRDYPESARLQEYLPALQARRDALVRRDGGAELYFIDLRR